MTTSTLLTGMAVFTIFTVMDNTVIDITTGDIGIKAGNLFVEL